MRFRAPFLGFDVFVAADMLFAVAVIAAAAGTVTELQLRIRHICAAADSAPMGVGRGSRLGTCPHRAGGGEGDRAGLFDGFSPRFDSPGKGDQILHIRADEQKVVSESNVA